MLKDEARSLLRSINDRRDGLSCGLSMAEVIRPDIGTNRVRLEKVWDEIMKLDPKAPPFAHLK